MNSHSAKTGQTAQGRATSKDDMSTACKSGRALQVLVADDDRSSRRFLVEALLQLDCAPQSAASQEHVLRRARRQSFDLLLLDYRWPQGDALPLIRQLRAEIPWTRRPGSVLVTTASRGSCPQAQLARLGIHQILGKPCCLEQLQHCLLELRPAVLETRPGQLAHQAWLRPLRQLLADELARTSDVLQTRSMTALNLADHLHRLRGAFHYAAAPALARSAGRLERHLRQGHPPDSQALHELLGLIGRTRRALLGELARKA